MEQVICAAVRATNGITYRCHRHTHGYMTINLAGTTPSTDHDAQGFITSENRFVGRAEAMLIQLAAGITSIAPGGYRDHELHSEDLY